MQNIADTLYRVRQDFAIYQQQFAARVGQVYANGFDVRVEDEIVYFTSDQRRLNPSSVLVSADVIKQAVTGMNVAFADMHICIGQQWLQRGPDIKIEWNCTFIANDFARENLKTIRKCLSLFGRKSIVRNLLANTSVAGDTLMNNRDQILQWPTDFGAIRGFIGRGEGLTPAFDDFISGIVFADRFFKLNLISLPPNFLSAVSMQTTLQSCQQLQFSFMGKLNIAFEELLGILCHSKLKTVEVIRAMNFGHSSGSDILHGILHHLANFLNIRKNLDKRGTKLHVTIASESCSSG